MILAYTALWLLIGFTTCYTAWAFIDEKRYPLRLGAILLQTLMGPVLALLLCAWAVVEFANADFWDTPVFKSKKGR